MVAVDLIGGARPNFMKLGPVCRALREHPEITFAVVHTGQHYDPSMNDVFFQELGIPKPAVNLEVGSGSHGAQTARIIERYEAHLLKTKPDATVVFGDVNSTIACALAAVKLGVPVCHVEAGLRSFDRTMPEEINRILTDSIADLLLVSEPSGLVNLKNEGVSDAKVKLVGNVMIDSLMGELERARELQVHRKYELAEGRYGLITLHRPSNVDNPDTLKKLLELFVEFGHELPLVFPVHPRTKAAMARFGLESILKEAKSIQVLDALPYRENLGLMASAKLVLTDSGGMQEETAIVNVPCITMRENTERPVTVELGTSVLVGNDIIKLRDAFKTAASGKWKQCHGIPLWDGSAGKRIAEAISNWLRG